MLKTILLIVFCILAIASYVFCKKTKDTPILSIIMAGVSVILLIAVIFTGHLIKVDKEYEDNTPVINDIIEDESEWTSLPNTEDEKVTTEEENKSSVIESDEEENNSNDSKKQEDTNINDQKPLENKTDKTNSDSKPVGNVPREN